MTGERERNYLETSKDVPCPGVTPKSKAKKKKGGKGGQKFTSPAKMSNKAVGKSAESAKKILDERRLLEGISSINRRSRLSAAQRTLRRPMWEAKRIKNLLKIEETLMDIMMMSNAEVIDKCYDALRNDKVFEGEEYSKLLIFISGNLDEIYRGLCDETSNTSTDADIFCEQSKRLTFLDVKGQLLERFKPEQISRFGNNHIIYPSLSKDAYRKIINRKVNEAITGVSNYAPIKLFYDSSIIEHIYYNSVFPAQGTRPVFSGVQTIFISKLPDILSLCIEHSSAEAKLSIIKKELEPFLKVEFSDATVALLSVESPVNEVKDRLRDDAKRLVSVHESGHAVVFAVLYGKAPVQTVLNLYGDVSGKMLTASLGEEVHTIAVIRNMVKVFYAGLLAERVLFPSIGSTTGSHYDISEATRLIALSYRVNFPGKGKENVPVASPSNMFSEDNAIGFVMSSLDKDKLIKKTCEELFLDARKLVIENEYAIRQLAFALFENEDMNSHQVAVILNNCGIKCTPMEKDERLAIPEYCKLFNEHKK